VCLELTESRYQHYKTYDVFLKYCYPGLCGIKICSLKQLQDAEQKSCYKMPLDGEAIKVGDEVVRKLSFDVV